MALVHPAQSIDEPAIDEPAAGGAAARLRDLGGVAAPVTLAGDRLLPVLDDLAPLFPGQGLRRGTTVAVGGRAASSLALATLAGPSRAGAWCAVVGLPSLGLVAAAEAGIALDRLVLVAGPEAGEWATITAALLDALDVVLTRPPVRVRTADARRLAARARERGSVLVTTGGWDGPDVRLTGEAGEWQGLGEGHGHLVCRRVEVVGGGRGAAARERRARVWLPPRR